MPKLELKSWTKSKIVGFNLLSYSFLSMIYWFIYQIYFWLYQIYFYLVLPFFFQDGLLDRSWVAGVLPTEVMLSHIFTQFIVLLGQITITLVFVFLVFKIPCNGPVGWIVVIAILQGFAGMCYGKKISDSDIRK